MSRPKACSTSFVIRRRLLERREGGGVVLDPQLRLGFLEELLDWRARVARDCSLLNSKVGTLPVVRSSG